MGRFSYGEVLERLMFELVPIRMKKERSFPSAIPWRYLFPRARGRKVVARGQCNKRNVNFLALKLLFIDIRGNLGGEIKGRWLVGRYSPETASHSGFLVAFYYLDRS